VPCRQSCIPAGDQTQASRKAAAEKILGRQAVNELITVGSSVFIFASICMIHELLTFLL